MSEFKINAVDKRIFGGTTDVNVIVPMRYPWAWDTYLEANKNHWLAGNINPLADLADGQTYRQKLSPAVFTAVKTYLLEHCIVHAGWMLEWLPTIYRATTAPECRQYMLRHIQEASEWDTSFDTLKGALGVDKHDMVDANARLEAALSIGEWDGSLTSYCDTVFLMLSFAGLNLTALETWLLYDAGLPPQLRQWVDYVARDSAMQRGFYTALLKALAAENAEAADYLKRLMGYEISEVDANYPRRVRETISDKAWQHSYHVAATVGRELGAALDVPPSPYAAVESVAAHSQDKLEWD